MSDMRAVRGDEPKTLNRILDNALEHFSNFGYTGASVREITQSANVTKPTLYYYFKNKEELYRGLAQSCSEKILSGMQTATLADSAPLDERFMNLIRSQNELCDREMPVVKFMYLAGVTPSRHVPDVGIREFNAKISTLISQMVDDAVAKNQVGSGRAGCTKIILQGLYQMNLNSRLLGTPIAETSIQEALNCTIEIKH